MCMCVWMSISRCSRHKTKNNNFYTVKHRREGIWLWILACLLVFTAPGQPVPPPPPSPSVYNILQTTSSRVEEREKIEIFFCFLISSSSSLSSSFVCYKISSTLPHCLQRKPPVLLSNSLKVSLIPANRFFNLQTMCCLL